MVTHHKLQRAVAVCAALAALAACRGRSPDAGGDTSLARDLAEAQLAGVAASRTTVPKTGADTTVIRDTAFGLDSARRRPAASPTAPAATVARVAAPTARIAAATKKVMPADPCASSASTDQTTCVSHSEKRADTRLASLHRSIVSAVRKQQRVAARAPDPLTFASSRGRRRNGFHGVTRNASAEHPVSAVSSGQRRARAVSRSSAMRALRT